MSNFNIHTCPTCDHKRKTKTFQVTMTVEMEIASVEQLEKEIRNEWGFDEPNNKLLSLEVRDVDEIDFSGYEQMGG